MIELILKVNGMMCEGCENRIKNSIATIEGIDNATADHVSGIVKITLKKDIDKKIIEERIEDIGFEVVKED